jgi:ankyrin repeat protein
MPRFFFSEEKRVFDYLEKRLPEPGEIAAQCIKMKWYEALETVLKQSPDCLYYKVDDDEPLPIYAIVRGRRKALALFIAAGFDINLRDEYGDTLLILSVKYNYYKQAKFLLRNGADVSAVGADERTALSIAKDSNRKKMVSLLKKWLKKKEITKK